MCFELHQVCELYRGAFRWLFFYTVSHPFRLFLRGDDAQLNTFACFLDESYDSDDLCFFVEARDKMLKANKASQKSALDKDDGSANLQGPESRDLPAP